MQNIKEFFILLFILLRMPFKLIAIQFLRVLPLVATVKAGIVSRYYRWKFPQIMQMRKLVGSEGNLLYKELEQIRAEAQTAIVDSDFGLSKSQKKKRLANVHNAERSFFEKNRLRIVNGQLYQLDKNIK